MSERSYYWFLILASAAAIALLLLSVEDRPLKDELMIKFLSMPVQDRADFISANLTPEMLRYMAITPCGKCADERRRVAYKSLTPEQKSYDNMFDPLNAYHTDYDTQSSGCSCHINPPCSYCTSKEQPND